MDRADWAFLVFLGLIGAWMGLYDYAQAADLVAREFVAVLGGLSGLYTLIRRWL